MILDLTFSGLWFLFLLSNKFQSKVIKGYQFSFQLRINRSESTKVLIFSNNAQIIHFSVSFSQNYPALNKNTILTRILITRRKVMSLHASKTVNISEK